MVLMTGTSNSRTHNSREESPVDSDDIQYNGWSIVSAWLQGFCWWANEWPPRERTAKVGNVYCRYQ